MIIVLAGPTASGKSDMAVSLAKKIGGAVINADAFQVYEELNIATAKPSVKTRNEVPHYLFDFVPLTNSYSVYEYQKDLRNIIDRLLKNKTPIIIAGGTGLYIRAGLYDYEFPEEAEIDMSKFEAMDSQSLYDYLTSIDPEEAQTIHPHNRVRVLRAIKVYLSTGKKRSEIKSNQNHKPIYTDLYFFGLEKERSNLYQRCDLRVDKMFDEGLVEENFKLYKRYGESPRAFQAIGVKELFPYFKGEISLDECKAAIKKSTRNYVKRQETFFRNQFDINWISEEDDIYKAVPSLLTLR